MSNSENIDDDPESYGSKGQRWHPNFVAYMVEIVTHPVFDGMPDALKEDGKIQWEAPSNRGSGQYQHTHHRRREWWRAKAGVIGVDPLSDKWISTVAKRIHPIGEKPCKRCGRVLRIAYVYPNGHLKGRLIKEFGSSFEFDPLEAITDLVQRISDQYGVESLARLRSVLRARDFEPPEQLTTADDWVDWLEEEYIPTEPTLLSPGVMSNAPDRFDGFHSFNLCCRRKADTGRHDSNMRSYTTDRRVFEFWSDGDWIAADRMMGLISSRLRSEACADGGVGPATADHIGPVSLGFSHRPHFRLLSRSANSAKNNRMTLQDVSDLISAERRGEAVASWYALPLWDLRKDQIETEEEALRLSKLLRDNQRVAMHLLVEVYRAEHYTFLASLLNLECANYSVGFENLRVINYVPIYDRPLHELRKTKYSGEQKSRRLRIGFEALRSYGEKENRHRSIVDSVLDAEIERHLLAAIDCLANCDSEIDECNSRLKAALVQTDATLIDRMLRDVADSVPRIAAVKNFRDAKSLLTDAMAVSARRLSALWNSDRYVRTTFEEIDGDGDG